MSLVQAIEMLEQKKVLILYTTNALRLFYNDTYDITTDQLCLVNCNNWPKLLNKGEWDYYIFEKGFKEDETTEISKLMEKATNTKFYTL